MLLDTSRLTLRDWCQPRHNKGLVEITGLITNHGTDYGLDIPIFMDHKVIYRQNEQASRSYLLSCYFYTLAVRGVVNCLLHAIQREKRLGISFMSVICGGRVSAMEGLLTYLYNRQNNWCSNICELYCSVCDRGVPIKRGSTVHVANYTLRSGIGYTQSCSLHHPNVYDRGWYCEQLRVYLI